ncbi:MAG: bifunctional folylpolyglutamate synthase/dihydrofolate synthase [Euryarchaeota archaeon]|nr:bifunctional folylpolyglutamate synthase/dihydrofolate synthase [Euryarchaeota archaeon]
MELPEIEYIYNLRRFGMKLNLDVMYDFAHLLGDPQDELNFAHIAGTNGKGSTASFLYNIMRRRYRTGLYTSPHLVRYNERIVVNGEEIPTEYIVKFVRKYRKTIEKMADEMRNPTFFEVTTALALKYFKDAGAEFAVMEVGLGGRLDATNIIVPDVTAIVSIDKEHTNVLGKTIPKIAREKAGIIKKGVPVVVGEHKKAATRVIKKIADARNAEYHNIHEECEFNVEKMSIDGMRVSISTPVRDYKLHTKMIGEHQCKNMAVAIRMAELLQDNYSITTEDIIRGVDSALWRGRFEVKAREPLLIFDSAHNPAGARVLARTLRALNLRPTLVFSMLADKDIDSYLRYMKGVTKRVIVSEINYHRRMPAEELANKVKTHIPNVEVIKEPCEALRRALEYEDPVLACGSIYFLGELEQCPL